MLLFDVCEGDDVMSGSFGDDFMKRGEGDDSIVGGGSVGTSTKRIVAR